MTSSDYQERLSEILQSYCTEVEVARYGLEMGSHNMEAHVSRIDRYQAIAQEAITSLMLDVIGHNDDMTLKINPASDEDLLISIGENANNRLRNEIRNTLGKGKVGS